jgi:hypothetical protein
MRRCDTKNVMTRLRSLRSGLLLTLLALAGQFAWEAIVPDPALAEIAFGPICRGTGRQAPAKPAHRGRNGTLCPLCTALAMPASALAKSPAARPPHVIVVRAAVALPAPVTNAARSPAARLWPEFL